LEFAAFDLSSAKRQQPIPNSHYKQIFEPTNRCKAAFYAVLKQAKNNADGPPLIHQVESLQGLEQAEVLRYTANNAA